MNASISIMASFEATFAHEPHADRLDSGTFGMFLPRFALRELS